MKNSKLLKTLLVFSGIIAAGIGAAILLNPSAFYATYGIDLGGYVSLFNEVRAAGGALLAVGILIISGSFLASLTYTSVVVAALLYLSYGASRILSFAIDGMPSEGLVQAAALEIFIGVVCLFALLRYRENRARHE
jgi:hypothetical protein